MTRPIYPARDPMRVHLGVRYAQFIAGTIIAGAVMVTPDALVSLVTGGWG